MNDMKKPLSIAIDGPVGAGKSTISEAVARALGILHLDTGAMYRAWGLAALRAGIDPEDERAVCQLSPDISVAYQDGEQKTLLAGEDVSLAIRAQEAGGAASCVSRYAPVRARMVALQREIASAQSMLLDGRDIGTVVLPDADVKIFLTASAEKRAERRLAELLSKGADATYAQVLAEVRERDLRDTTRAVDPLKQARDAVLVDTSALDFEQSVAAILSLVEAAHERNA